MRNKYFKYFQPNELDTKDEYSDCTIRALCKVFDKSWGEVFEMLIPIIKEHQLLPNYMFYSRSQETIASELGLERNKISVRKGSKCPTVLEFTKAHPQGRYIVQVAHHTVAVVDGAYYDTWDCGNKPMFSYYELKR